jgi:hypothetical protein
MDNIQLISGFPKLCYDLHFKKVTIEFYYNSSGFQDNFQPIWTVKEHGKPLIILYI